MDKVVSPNVFAEVSASEVFLDLVTLIFLLSPCWLYCDEQVSTGQGVLWLDLFSWTGDPFPSLRQNENWKTFHRAEEFAAAPWSSSLGWFFELQMKQISNSKKSIVLQRSTNWGIRQILGSFGKQKTLDLPGYTPFKTHPWEITPLCKKTIEIPCDQFFYQNSITDISDVDFMDWHFGIII